MRPKSEYYAMLHKHYPNLNIAELDHQQAMLNFLSATRYTDTVGIKHSGVDAIAQLWNARHDTEEEVGIPSDIILTNKVPLPTIEIRYYEDKIPMKEPAHTWYVSIGDDLPSVLDSLSKDCPIVPVGVISCQILDEMGECRGRLMTTILVGYNNSLIGTSECGWQLTEDTTIDCLADLLQCFENNIPCILYAWYNIQFAMLHPLIRDAITSSSTKAPIHSNKPTKKNKRRTVKYVRKHIIDDMAIASAISSHLAPPPSFNTSPSRKYQRHTMSWYVTGHWRINKRTGAHKFIQGYWKGPLRCLKQNLDNGRDRVITLPE